MWTYSGGVGLTSGQGWPPEVEAKLALEQMVQGRRLEIGFAGRRTDRYGRLLAQVFAQGADDRVKPNSAVKALVTVLVSVGQVVVAINFAHGYITRKYNYINDFNMILADGVGFEPTRELPLCRFSRPVP